MSLRSTNVWVASIERESGVRARDASGGVRTIRILIVDDHKPFVEAGERIADTAGRIDGQSQPREDRCYTVVAVDPGRGILRHAAIGRSYPAYETPAA